MPSAPPNLQRGGGQLEDDVAAIKADNAAIKGALGTLRGNIVMDVQTKIDEKFSRLGPIIRTAIINQLENIAASVAPKIRAATTGGAITYTAIVPAGTRRLERDISGTFADTTCTDLSFNIIIDAPSKSEYENVLASHQRRATDLLSAARRITGTTPADTRRKGELTNMAALTQKYYILQKSKYDVYKASSVATMTDIVGLGSTQSTIDETQAIADPDANAKYQKARQIINSVNSSNSADDKKAKLCKAKLFMYDALHKELKSVEADMLRGAGSAVPSPTAPVDISSINFPSGTLTGGGARRLTRRRRGGMRRRQSRRFRN